MTAFFFFFWSLKVKLLSVNVSSARGGGSKGVGRHKRREEIARKELGKRRLGHVLRNFLLIALKSLKVASHPAAPLTRRLARRRRLLSCTRATQNARTNTHTLILRPSQRQTHPHTLILRDSPPPSLPGLSPVYPGRPARPWPG